jgi:hypothetical protein
MPPIPTSSQSRGIKVFSGLYGSAYRDGRQLLDVTECGGTINQNQITVPQVGSIDEAYKRGRRSRSGNFVVQKIDSRWEFETLSIFSASLQKRRAWRDLARTDTTFVRPDAPFSLLLEYDDPDALGIEQLQLNNVQIWDTQIGFNQADELVGRQFTITWESETYIAAFHVDDPSSVTPTAIWYTPMPAPEQLPPG